MKMEKMEKKAKGIAPKKDDTKRRNENNHQKDLKTVLTRRT